MRNKKSMTGILFLSIFVAVFVLFLVTPTRVFSENENRVLTNNISFSLHTVMSGEQGTAVEDFMTDQMPGRDWFQTLASDTRRFAGFKEINGVYLADDGYLITKLTEEDIPDGQLDKNTSSLNNLFASSGVEPERIAVMPVPGADCILSNLLPDGAAVFDSDKAMMTLAGRFADYIFIDLRETLKESAEKTQTFYRTDHHWTTAGAYAAYEEYCRMQAEKGFCSYTKNSDNYSNQSLYSDINNTIVDYNLSTSNVKPDNSSLYTSYFPKLSINSNTDDYDYAYDTYKCRQITQTTDNDSNIQLQTVSTDFHGSLYSKVLCSDIPYDSVQIVANRGVDEVVVDNGTSTSNSCYDNSFLDKKDKYGVFFGGNYSHVSIATQVENGKRLLVIKDSFANSFVPFLTTYYQEIHMIDLRYFTGSVKDFINEQQITDILVLCELSNMLTDTNFSKLNGGLQQ